MFRNCFPQEECEDLHQRVKDGLLKKPTVVSSSEIPGFAASICIYSNLLTRTFLLIGRA